MKPSPICQGCAVEMRCAKNDYPVKVGERHWLGDAWQCPSCSTTVVVGFGSEPVPDPDPRTVSGALRVTS